MTGQQLILDLWRKSLITAREAGGVPATAVEELIWKSREALTSFGCSKHDADVVLFSVYTEIHWDWNQPTDRVFESMLDTELMDFYKRQGMDSL